jgi:guanylate kinase
MRPTLDHFQEFEEALRNYHVSDEAAAELKDLKLVLLLGPSSSGRNTIIKRLADGGKFYYIVSDTTRPPRINDGVPEQNGVEYWFRNEKEILTDIKAGNFLEAELIHNQQVSGISIRELKKAKAEGKIAITDVDIRGVHNIMKVKPDTIAIMLLPPSFEEWQKRFSMRAAMTMQEQTNRFNTAYQVFADGLQQRFYHFVISEDLEQSANIIESIADGGSNPHQDRGQEVLQHLHADLEHKLYPSR